MARDTPSKKRKKVEASATGRKRKSAETGRGGNGGSKNAAVFYQVELPFSLNTLLVDECNYITRKGFDSPHGYDCEPAPRPARSVHNLPAKVTVKQVLDHYMRKRGGGGNDKQKATAAAAAATADDNEAAMKHKRKIKKFCNGLCLLFDDALPVCLLYPEERPQYESLQNDEELKLKRPSEIYGSTFLLRFLVRLPRLLAAEPQSEMDEMGPLIADLIVLLQKNRQACFNKDVYREPKKHELFAWEIQLQKKQQQRDNNNNVEEDGCGAPAATSSPMAISRTP